MISSANNHHNYSLRLLKIILVFLNLLLLLDNFKFSVSGQLLDVAYQSSIIINDKLYFFGGLSKPLFRYTNQTIYLDLSTSSFSLNQSLPIKLLTPTSTVSVPPFSRASLALGGNNNFD